MSQYLSLAQTSIPYGTCWNWDSFPGTQFAAKADSWLPTYYNDQSYRCLPDPIPNEFQIFNQSRECPEAKCSVCTGKAAYGAIAQTGGSCPTCKKELLALMAGYAD